MTTMSASDCSETMVATSYALENGKFQRVTMSQSNSCARVRSKGRVMTTANCGLIAQWSRTSLNSSSVVSGLTTMTSCIGLLKGGAIFTPLCIQLSDAGLTAD